MNSEELFEQIIKEVLPLAVKNMRNYFGIEEEMPIFAEHLSERIVYFIYRKFLKLLLSAPQSELVLKWLCVDRISDFQNLSLDIRASLPNFLNQLNHLKNTNYTTKSPCLNYILIKWGFLPIFEDILYVNQCALPITIPQYFDELCAVYQTLSIRKMVQTNVENANVNITICLKNLDTGKSEELARLDLFIEGSTIEGMFVAAHFYNKNPSFTEICFIYENEEIQFENYIKMKRLLFAKEFEFEKTKYTAIIYPIGKIVNFNQETFPLGFEMINHLVDGNLELQSIINNDETVNIGPIIDNDQSTLKESEIIEMLHL